MQQWINGVLHDLSQQAAWSVDWEVDIGGKNRTGMLRPYLIDISVTDKAGTTSDSCSLTLDDTDGKIALDMEGLDITVLLQGQEVFQGTIETARSTGSRGGGRLIPITAKGFDTRGKAKQIQSFHKDDATLGEFMEEAAKRAGFSTHRLPVSGHRTGLRSMRAFWTSANAWRAKSTARSNCAAARPFLSSEEAPRLLRLKVSSGQVAMS